MTRRSLTRFLALSGATGITLFLATQAGEAHKPILSKYPYNEDVFPILREKCARCHVPGGVAPMSLLTFKEAVPWAESLRMELISGHMPPWSAEPGFGAFQNSHALSGRELDVLLVWASGGTPRGDSSMALPTIDLKNDWTLGTPDLALQMPTEFTLPADLLEDTQEFVLATGTTTHRSVTAVDLLPGTPAIVRKAVISISTPKAKAAAAPDSSKTPSPHSADNVLAVWLPGSDPVRTAPGTAFHLPARSQLTLRVHYKKTWKYEGTAMTDRSTVGLYFSDRPASRPVRTFAMASGDVPAADGPGQKLAFSHVLTENLQAIALRPDVDRPNVKLQVEAVRPDGSRLPVIRLAAMRSWDRRYWFDEPLSLPRGTRIEAIATFVDPAEVGTSMPGMSPAPVAASSDGAPASTRPIRLAFDVVAVDSRGTVTEQR